MIKLGVAGSPISHSLSPVIHLAAYKELKINAKCRFIKVLVKNYGAIPTGQAGEGKPAWLFLDEISVY